ncbi:hypothetical protein BIFGAL_04138 [Bifidobacterium gallicum DSM 20093 = LMG 11596]|uniref:Uncharacterized protein n=1 Tax=Bifidobacterium gallicum DSM 20093 = LMG 11596 TaxID=561180 RepID=D1NW91_9BIFI|nr:hypothetical protein BIFGAL_04138 [Bifidobacterium gallicum DSM 20093 = LMG 11596]
MVLVHGHGTAMVVRMRQVVRNVEVVFMMPLAVLLLRGGRGALGFSMFVLDLHAFISNLSPQQQ